MINQQNQQQQTQPTQKAAEAMLHKFADFLREVPEEVCELEVSMSVAPSPYQFLVRVVTKQEAMAVYEADQTTREEVERTIQDAAEDFEDDE